MMYKNTGSLTGKPLSKDGDRRWEITTPPTVEPVTVDELKLFARIDGSTEDDMLEGFLTAIRQATEEYLGRALITQTITLRMDFWPDTVIELPHPPLIAITSVSTLDESDTATIYSSDNYYVDTTGQPGRLVLEQGVTAPTNTDRYTSGFQIIYTAGYGATASTVPALIKEAIKLWTSIFYELRVYDPKKPPMEVKVLLDTYKIWRV